MEVIKKKYLLFSLVALFIGLNSYLIYEEIYYLNALPLILIIAYLGVFHTKTTFLLVVFFTPLSINIEEFNDGGIGLFLPSEPILFGLMVWIVFKEIKSPVLTLEFWKHPLVLSILFYVLWIFITSITSVLPGVSFKFLLMKLWFIIPIIYIGTLMFKKQENISKFLWCYALGMTIVIIYTLIRHAGYNFGGREGHWVMSPLFKDHTIYGAAVAINLFFVLGLLLYKKHPLQTQFLLLTMLTITLLGLYFSYTRGAWVSVLFAIGVWATIYYRIKFRYLFFVAVVFSVAVYFSWDQIQMTLAKNKQEHTTTNFEERLQSAANISSDASNLERINRWEAAINMFQAKPVFGFGPATYAFEYAPYQNPESHTIISTNFGDGGNAHSEYLGALAETGLPGMLSVLIFVGVLFYVGITLLLKIKNFHPEEKGLYILLFCIILAMSTYFFHGILNNYLDTDKAAIPIYGAAAIFIAQSLKWKKAT